MASQDNNCKRAAHSAGNTSPAPQEVADEIFNEGKARLTQAQLLGAQLPTDEPAELADQVSTAAPCV